MCPECGASFNTGSGVELNESQAGRRKEVFNAVFEMCKCLAGNKNLEWDIAYIGEIAEFAINTLGLHGERIHYPSVVTNPDGSQYIEEYYNQYIEE